MCPQIYYWPYVQPSCQKCTKGFPLDFIMYLNVWEWAASRSAHVVWVHEKNMHICRCQKCNPEKQGFSGLHFLHLQMYMTCIIINHFGVEDGTLLANTQYHSCWCPGFLCVLPAINSHYVDGLMQERRKSIANALEICLSCTNPLILTM